MQMNLNLLWSIMLTSSEALQIAAGAVYWEYTRSAAASEEKKEQERLRHEQLVQAADEQRKVRLAQQAGVLFNLCTCHHQPVSASNRQTVARRVRRCM